MPEPELSVAASGRPRPHSRRPSRLPWLLLALSAAGPATAAPAAPPVPAAVPLEQLMAGEYAFQAGQLADAARWYLEAARAAEGDVLLAERATRIAMLANDDARAGQALKLWRQRAPDSLALQTATASLALRQGQVRQARRELLRILATPDPRAWRFALVALAGGRDPDVVARVLGDLVDRGAIPEQLQAWQEFGRLSLRLDAPKLSARIIDEMVRRFPDEPRVAVLRAGQLHQAGQTDRARAMLAVAEPRAAADPEVRGMLAAAYESLGDFAAAARVMALGLQDTQSYGIRASLLARGDDGPTLATLYDELSAADGGRPDPARRMLLGRIAEFLKRPAEAVDWYRGVPGGPQRAEARIRIAAALYEQGKVAEAYAEAHALQNDAGSDDEARRNAYLLEGELRQRAGDTGGEIEALGRGLAAYPDDSALLYARALAWERQDRIDRTEADLRKVLVAEPENVAALNALGYTLADRTHRYQEALELIDRARTAEPDNAAIVDSYGWVLYRLGRNEEALVELRRAWGMLKDPEIGAHVGEVLWVLGRREEARRYFEESRRLDPDNRSLRRALDKLQVTLPPPVPEPEPAR
ncbi:tetratricopeptide repeat protein [Pseudoxanthomonas suwonensis]|uniref:Membrane protein n=1 Tax=Pseudoxanthomonas suwonensis TaxID=314722 RepID=A0A0E3UMH3_9GAMM|nr:tetratricopeptide repeat protein [Pseudoxanthomonas suwonensis]AKC86035.1 membrane protein [Pseudoxanthomonas suwonensis]